MPSFYVRGWQSTVQLSSLPRSHIRKKRTGERANIHRVTVERAEPPWRVKAVYTNMLMAGMY